MICSKYENWNICIENEGEEVLYDVSLFILKIFNEIFGQDTMKCEECTIINSPTANNPMLITSTNPIIIRTSAASVNHWSQYIYQFSHELTHYAIRQKKLDKSIYVNWFEETLCEAMSLYVLDYARTHWSESKMNRINPNYSSSLKKYLSNILNTEANNDLKNCKTLDALEIIDTNSQDIRKNRTNERFYLYDVFKNSPNNIKVITDYTKYINKDNLTINFSNWIENALNGGDKEFIKKLKVIQPVIQ